MQLDLRQNVLNYDRTQGLQEAGHELTFRDVISAALNNVAPGEILDAEKKSRIFRISSLVWGKSPKIDLTTEDINFILDRAGATIQSPLVFGRLEEFLIGQAPEIEAPVASDDPVTDEPAK